MRRKHHETTSSSSEKEELKGSSRRTWSGMVGCDWPLLLFEDTALVEAKLRVRDMYLQFEPSIFPIETEDKLRLNVTCKTKSIGCGNEDDVHACAEWADAPTTQTFGAWFDRNWCNDSNPDSIVIEVIRDFTLVDDESSSETITFFPFRSPSSIDSLIKPGRYFASAMTKYSAACDVPPGAVCTIEGVEASTLNVKTLTRKQFKFEYDLKLLIKFLKERIRLAEGPPPEQFDLIFDHRRLKPWQSPASIGVVDGGTINLLLNLRGS